MRLEKCKDSQGICELRAAKKELVVRCVKCGGIRPLSRCYADLDGVAFVDYYCLECANKVETELEKS